MNETRLSLTPEGLCAEYAGRVYRFAAIVAKGDVEAEDLAQEALLRAIRHLRSFQASRGSVENWLWRIVVNAARDAGRVAARRMALWERLTTVQLHAEGVESLALRRLTDRELLLAVRTLPKRDRAILALRYGADLDYPTVGKILGLRPHAATMATRRALIKLRMHLEAIKQ
jgi:RNA polymerase sigma-70 factor (ECF subfamily)